MNAALRSYYLQQLGIDEWVSRKIPHARRIIIAGEDISRLLTTPAGRLLHRMLDSIGLNDKHVTLLPQATGCDWMQDIAYRDPLAVIILGENPAFLESSVATAALTVITLPSMAALLKRPGAKKTAWEALLRLQAYLVKTGLSPVNV